MSYTKAEFGNFTDGTKAYLYTVRNSNGISATFTDVGGTWVSMLVPDKEGNYADVVLGHDNAECYLQNPRHFGAILGRNANRIAGAKVEIAGIVYELEKNNGKHNAHSGNDYFHTRKWDAEVAEKPEGTQITFQLFSPHLDQNLPGNADIKVSYTLTEENSLKIDYEMVSDADTIANFTNHAYFNLAGHANGSIKEQRVWINADYFLTLDQESIPTGQLEHVKGTPMDFTVLKEIGKDLTSGHPALRGKYNYDNNWVLRDYTSEVRLVAKAVDIASGRVMEVYTDLPGVQFYTANFTAKQLPGKEGAEYEGCSSYCFETQLFPDAIHHQNFHSPILKKGEKYHTTTIYKFGTSEVN